MAAIPTDPMDDPTPVEHGRLHGKVAIVTGASSGLGRAIAFRLSREGAKVVCGDLKAHATLGGYRNEDEGYQTEEYIVSKGGQAIFVKVDVGNAKDVQALVGRAVQEYGELHIMINNAGICPEASEPHAGRLIDETDEDMFDKVMRVNLRAVFLGCKYAVRQFLKQDLCSSGDRGWIVNTGSTASLVVPDPGFGKSIKLYCRSLQCVSAYPA